MGRETRIEPNDLFRQEAIEGRRMRYSGEALVRSPLVTLPVTLALLAIVLAAAVLSVSLPFAREFRANGWLVPEAGLIEVRSPAQGTITALFTAEGATVRAGDRLATLSTGTRLEEGGSVEDELLGASRATTDLLGSREATLVTAHRANADDNRIRLQSMLQDRQKLASLVALKRQNAAAKEAQLANYGELVERGFGSGVEHQRRQSDVISSRQDIIEGEIRLSTLERDIEELQGRAAQEQSSFELALNEIRQQRMTVSSDVVRATARRGISVTAPTSGTVSHLGVRSGQAVTAATPLISIVPPGRLQVQLLAPAQRSGLPEPGARARILVDNFPFRRYGALTGYVKNVSRSTILADDATASIGVKVPYFVVTVVLDKVQNNRLAQADLRPGMTVDGRLQLEKRSLLNWLLPRS